MSERIRRLFFAIWPSDALQEAIEKVTRRTVALASGRGIPAHNFHITLAFLGSIAATRIDDLRSCIQGIIVDPFELQFGEIRAWRRQRLLCLEPTSGHEAIVELVSRLRRSLEHLGFAVENRPVRAHVTLAREIQNLDVLAEPIPDLRWFVRRFELVESMPGEKGSTYTVIS